MKIVTDTSPLHYLVLIEAGSVFHPQRRVRLRAWARREAWLSNR